MIIQELLTIIDEANLAKEINADAEDLIGNLGAHGGDDDDLEESVIQIDEKTAALNLADYTMEDAIELLEKRLAAARRALSLAHKLKDPAEKKKHFSLIMTNMNVVRNQLNKILNVLSNAA